MTLFRRSAGLGALLLSVLGLLLCVAGTAGVWAGKSRLDTVAAALFATAGEAFDFMETRLDRVDQTLDRSRQRVSGLSGLAERLNAADADLSTRFEPLSQTLDDVFADLQAAEHWLDASEAVARGIGSVSQAIASSDAVASRAHESASAGLLAGKVAEFSAVVAEALARLQVMRQELVDLRDKKTLAREFTAAMVAHVTELDAKLANVSVRIDAFNAQVSTARASCVDLGRSVHRWIAFAAVTLTLILLWFGVSQMSMMNHAWRFAGLQAGGKDRC